MTKDITLGLVRHGLTALGGVLGARGVIAASDVELAVGAIMTLVAVGWSVLAKRAA